MKAILIKKILVWFSLVILVNPTSKTQKIESANEIEDFPSKPVQVLILKISIDNYASKIELLQSEINMDKYYKNNPYKTVE